MINIKSSQLLTMVTCSRHKMEAVFEAWEEEKV